MTANVASRPGANSCDFARVVAVEPDDKMRALIDAETTLAGSAEAIPLESASVDAAFVGEAFHWFDARRAIAELARVLVPRGCLALISTHWWETEPPLPTRAEALLRERYRLFQVERRPRWDNAFATSPFEPLRLERFEEAITVDADALLELYSTTSSLAALPDDERIEPPRSCPAEADRPVPVADQARTCLDTARMT
jgi:SAM-dependent methyltransferase